MTADNGLSYSAIVTRNHFVKLLKGEVHPIFIIIILGGNLKVLTNNIKHFKTFITKF